MAYPLTLDSFSTKVPHQDIYRASHINALQDSIVNIETELGYGSTRPASTAIANTMMKRDVNGVAYENKYGVELTNSGTISIPNGVFTAIPWATTRNAFGSMWNISAPSRINIIGDGVVIINCFAGFLANATGERALAIRANGPSGVYLGRKFWKPNTTDAHFEITKVKALTAIDYIEIMVYQDSGGSLNVPFSNWASPELSVYIL